MALRCLSFAGKELILSGTGRTSVIRSAVATTAWLPTRHISLSSQTYAKKILVEEADNFTTIRAEYVESSFAPRLVKTGREEEHTCPLCALDIEVKHTDVLILSQFLRKDGCLLPRRVTGICSKQQSRLKYLVAMSQKSGLMPNLAPSWSKKDPRRRFGSKKYNRYFDESTLD